MNLFNQNDKLREEKIKKEQAKEKESLKEKIRKEEEMKKPVCRRCKGRGHSRESCTKPPQPGEK